MSNPAPAAPRACEAPAGKGVSGSLGVWAHVSVTVELLAALTAPSCCLGASRCGAPCSRHRPQPAAAATCQHTRHPSAAAPRACRESVRMQSPELAPELGRGSPRADSTKLSPCAHLPRSTMRPSLSTRIWSAPTTVESLQRKAGCYSRSEGRGSGGVCTVQGATSTGAVTSEQEDRSVCPSWGAGQLRELSTSRINPFPSSLPMCNNDGGAVGADFGQGSLDVPFCLRVECRCRLRERQGMRKGCRQHGQLLGQGVLQSRARLGWGLLPLPHPAG